MTAHVALRVRGVTPIPKGDLMSVVRRPFTLSGGLMLVAVLLVAFAPAASAQRRIINDGGSDSALLPTPGSTTATLPAWTILVLIVAVVATAATTALITLAIARVRYARSGNPAAGAA
jgi:hypothetical protein